MSNQQMKRISSKEKKMFKTLLTIVLIFGSLTTFSHEGHDEAPGSIKANHGGTVKPGKQLNLEYVVSGNEVKLFPVSHEGKDLSAADVKITATTKLPKGKAEPAKIDFKDGAFVTNVDFKTAYRIEMVVEADLKGKKNSFKFQIEK